LTYLFEKYERQRVSDDIPYMKWKNQKMFQTTNQIKDADLNIKHRDLSNREQ